MDFSAETVSIVLGAILASKALAMFVVNLTDTPLDDKWVGKAYKALEVIAGIVNDKKAKQYSGEVTEIKKATTE